MFKWIKRQWETICIVFKFAYDMQEFQAQTLERTKLIDEQIKELEEIRVQVEERIVHARQVEGKADGMIHELDEMQQRLLKSLKTSEKARRHASGKMHDLIVYMDEQNLKIKTMRELQKSADFKLQTAKKIYSRIEIIQSHIQLEKEFEGVHGVIEGGGRGDNMREALNKRLGNIVSKYAQLYTMIENTYPEMMGDIQENISPIVERYRKAIGEVLHQNKRDPLLELMQDRGAIESELQASRLRIDEGGRKHKKERQRLGQLAAETKNRLYPIKAIRPQMDRIYRELVTHFESSSDELDQRTYEYMGKPQFTPKGDKLLVPRAARKLLSEVIAEYERG